MSRGAWFCLLVVVLAAPGLCWDMKEMELFDLVEEVNENFYQVMGISQVGGEVVAE